MTPHRVIPCVKNGLAVAKDVSLLSFTAKQNWCVDNWRQLVCQGKLEQYFLVYHIIIERYFQHTF